ncbi:MAG: short-chain dehydrogenase [Bacteroidetes bacterium]|nr:MAG: short-chain dehydrogenase [Bacteroidota bacterium]
MNAVITGASRGLGFATAEIFAKNGFDLLLTSQNEVLMYKALENLTTRYPTASIKAKPFDLADKTQARAFGQWALNEARKKNEENRRLDVLVNNAGQFIPGSVHNEGDGVLENLIAINLYSAYHLTRELLPEMMKQKHGHIFNICSIAALQAYHNGGAYSISKFAMAGFSKNLREEMKEYGIKVTAVYPGAAYTDSWASAGVDPARLMEAHDVAAMVYSASQLSLRACVEEIILRPQRGDL